jgi:3-methyladenine DNA glycosylase AlkD
MAHLTSKISLLIDEDFKKLGNTKFAQRRNKLIGKRIISYGVSVQELRKITKTYFKQFPKAKWKEIIEELISTKVFEDQIAGIFLLNLYFKREKKINIFEIKELIEDYIDNWATCDTISSEVVVNILKYSPKEIQKLDSWIKSRNIWLKRAALVTMVKLKNKIKNWRRIALYMLSSLNKEQEPILQKAIHWLQKEVF